MIGITAMLMSLVGTVLMLTLKMFVAVDSAPVIKAAHNQAGRTGLEIIKHLAWEIFIDMAARDKSKNNGITL